MRSGPNSAGRAPGASCRDARVYPQPLGVRICVSVAALMSPPCRANAHRQGIARYLAPVTPSVNAFAPDAQLAGTHALVVDDDVDLLELLASLLTAFGVEVTTATSGDEGFARFTSSPPDIVISDVQMERGSGLDLIRQIRALPPERGGLTPAIAMSGAAQVEETLDAGFHFHLAKPAQAQALLDAIRSFLREDPASERVPWSVGVEPDAMVIRFDGHVTGNDMRGLIEAIVAPLDSAKAGLRVVADLRHLTSFSPSVGAIAQLGVWRVRDKIREVTVIGGSKLARAIARGTCAVLGVPCTLVDVA